MNYLVVLFKNKIRKKIINKFVTLERAKEFFDKKVDENKSVYFGKRVENAKHCIYDLCLLEKKNNIHDSLFVKDKLGRQVKVELDDPEFKIIHVSNYEVEELIFDVKTKDKITMNQFYKKYIHKKGIILISRLNNKIVVQEDNNVNLFSLKTDYESKRFLSSLNDFFIDNSITNCIIVSETSKPQKKYLYDILEKVGIDKKSLYRTSTTYKPR
jgi:hypothetical protein